MTKLISVEYLLTMLQLPKIGRKTAIKLISDLNYHIKSYEDLMYFMVNEPHSFRLPELSESDFENAFYKASSILQKSEREDVKIISYLDDQYPQLLKATQDYPVLLNYKGNINILSEMPTVAIIGTRNASKYALTYGERMAKKCAQLGFNVVSGLAKGCDSAGHSGALEGNGITTAVLAHGLDTVYPPENRQLAYEILENNGLLLSEYFVGQKLLPNFFVERDRIQAGLSLGTIVIETDIKGGTMHTVNFTLEYGRKLACVQYKDETKYLNNDGNKMLIRQGKAHPVFEEWELSDFLKRLNADFNLGITSEGATVYPKPTIHKDKNQESKPVEKAPSLNNEQEALEKELEKVVNQLAEHEKSVKELKKRKKQIEKELGIIKNTAKAKLPDGTFDF